jgi:hypothetical protein
MTSHITGYPLILRPLSSQIKAHGGSGLAWAKSQPLSNSFSVEYTFNTEEGEKKLVTPNEFQFGLIDDGFNHHAYYLGDTGEYVLRTRTDTTNTDSMRIISSKTLGFSFKEAKKSLQLLFPKRTVWRLDDPIKTLKEHSKLSQLTL